MVAAFSTLKADGVKSKCPVVSLLFLSELRYASLWLSWKHGISWYGQTTVQTYTEAFQSLTEGL